MKSKKQTRRKFIRQSATASTGLLLASQFPLSAFPIPLSGKSKVIIAHSDVNGDLRYLSTIARDISERVKAEQELKFRVDFDTYQLRCIYA